MALINFSSSVCNYTTSAKVIAAAPGSVATNSYEYVDLEMVPDSDYYLDAANFTYLSNDYVDYVTFMPDGSNLKARVYLKSFTWPSERTNLEVPISGCASVIIPTAPTPSPTPTPTPTPVPTPPACPAVSGYFINKSIIELRGETRVFKVYGQQGATFSYTIIDNDNSFTLDTGTKTIPYSGFVNIEVIVPLNATARVFDVTITTAETCTLQLQTQPATFKLYQGIDEEWLGNTYECCEAAGVLLSTNCVGYDLYGTYTDGQCGTYNQLIETNSATCGYVPPAPPPTAPPPTTPPPPTAPPPTAPLGSYDCNTVNWATASYNCSTGAITVTPNYGSVTIHSYSPTSATQNSGNVTITYTFSDSESAWDNTNEQITCTNLSVSTDCTTPPTAPPPTAPTPPTPTVPTVPPPTVPPPTAPTPTVPTAPPPTAPGYWNLRICSNGGLATQQIQDDGTQDFGMFILASNGICYEIDSFQSNQSGGLVTIVSEFGDCQECLDGNGGV